jgi:hypothetical protein
MVEQKRTTTRNLPISFSFRPIFLMEFRGKMENRRRRCSLGFLISWNGFADTFTREMVRGSHERLLIVPLDGKQIQDAVRNGSFLNVIKSAWNKALMS